jgi:hypothetical protein
MGLSIQNNNITISDGSGNMRFTTDRRMPHLLLGYSGGISVPNARGWSSFTTTSSGGGGYGGGGATDITTRDNFSCEDIRDFVIATDSRIAQADAFVMPFFSISGGDIDTGGGAITGSGSSIVRLLVENSGYFAGAMILSPIVSGNSLILRVKSTAYCAGSDVANYPYVDNTGVAADYEAYVNSYSDLSAAWSSSGQAKNLYGRNHWIHYGQYEGRALPNFPDYAAYVDSYSDLYAAWSSSGQDKATWGYNHWINSGRYEGRIVPPATNLYSSTDLSGTALTIGYRIYYGRFT